MITDTPLCTIPQVFASAPSSPCVCVCLQKLIPKMTLLANRGEELPVHGDGEAVRSYLHVSDVANAFDIVLHKGVIGSIYNIGTQKERSVKSVVKTILKKFELGDDKIKHVKDRAFNDQRCAPLCPMLNAISETTPAYRYCAHCALHLSSYQALCTRAPPRRDVAECWLIVTSAVVIQGLLQ